MAHRIPRLALLVSLCLATVMFPATVGSAPAGAPIAVNTTGDGVMTDGFCSLREAVIATNTDINVGGCPPGNGPDLILVPAGLFTLTIPGQAENLAATGDLDVVGNLTIQGAGQDVTIIDAGDLDRAFQIAAGSVLSLSNLTVQNGTVPPAAVGGGIDVSGRLVLDSVTVKDNQAGWGGGVNVFGTGTALIGNSLIANNRVDNIGGGFLAYDGADITVQSTTLISNSAGYGGGVGALGTVNIFGSNVISDSAETAGGGVYVGGTGDVSLEHVNLSDNTSPFGAGLAAYGRAVVARLRSSNNQGDIGAGAAVASTGSLSMTHSTVENNESMTGTVTNNGFGWYYASTFWSNTAKIGGAVYNTGTANMTNVTMSGNDSIEDGGGILNAAGITRLANATIFGNNAGADGGGISNQPGATVDMRNSVLGNNTNGDSQSPDCSGTLNSQGGHNLISNSAGCTTIGDTTGNLLDVPADLGPLQDNGGPTWTHMPNAAFNGIDAASLVSCTYATGEFLFVDQRGANRHVDGDSNPGARCDMGATEFLAVLFNLDLPYLDYR